MLSVLRVNTIKSSNHRPMIEHTSYISIAGGREGYSNNAYYKIQRILILRVIIPIVVSSRAHTETIANKIKPASATQIRTVPVLWRTYTEHA